MAILHTIKACMVSVYDRDVFVHSMFRKLSFNFITGNSPWPWLDRGSK